MNIFTLVGSILVDSNQASESIGKTEEKAGGLAQKLGGVIGTAGKVGLAMGGAAVAGGAALMGIATNAAQTTDRIDKLSQKIGMGKESFQEWDYVLSQNGINIDVLQGGMKTLVNKFDDLKKGSSSATESFDRLNLKVEDLEGMSQDEVFNKVISGLQGIEDSSERAAIANDLLGRSGSELAPLLNAGAKATEDLKNKAHDLGLIMSDEAIGAGVLFTDTMDDLKRSMGTMAAQIGVSVMPIIQQLLEWIISNMPTIQEVFKTVFGVIESVVNTAVDIFTLYLLPILSTLYGWISDNFPAIKKTFETVFGAIKDAIKEVWTFIDENLLPIFSAIFNSVSDKFPQIKDIFSNVFGIAKDVVTTLWEVFKGLWNFVEPTFPLIGAVIETAFDIVIGIVEGVTGVFKTLVGWIKDAVSWINQFNSTEVEEKTTGSSGSFGGVSKDLKKYTDGSHANGLDYVPFDGYIAELHRGERVVPASENTGNKNSVVRHDHTGEIKIIGVGSEQEFVAYYNYTTDQLRRESRK